MAEKVPERYVCLMCGYMYDPRRGESRLGLAPGMDIAEAGTGWKCPRCGGPDGNFAKADDEYDQ